MPPPAILQYNSAVLSAHCHNLQGAAYAPIAIPSHVVLWKHATQLSMQNHIWRAGLLLQHTRQVEFRVWYKAALNGSALEIARTDEELKAILARLNKQSVKFRVQRYYFVQ